ILTATVLASAQTTFYYPHVVNGVQGSVIWKSTILLTNPSSSNTTSGTITFTSDNANLGAAGSPFPLTLTDEKGVSTTSSAFTFSIPALGTRRFISSGTRQFVSGFAKVAANAAVSGTAIFSEFDNAGHLIAEAGVPSASAVTRQAIFVDTIDDYKIGVAYAN